MLCIDLDQPGRTARIERHNGIDGLELPFASLVTVEGLTPARAAICVIDMPVDCKTMTFLRARRSRSGVAGIGTGIDATPRPGDMRRCAAKVLVNRPICQSWLASTWARCPGCLRCAGRDTGTGSDGKIGLEKSGRHPPSPPRAPPADRTPHPREHPPRSGWGGRGVGGAHRLRSLARGPAALAPWPCAPWPLALRTLAPGPRPPPPPPCTPPPPCRRPSAAPALPAPPPPCRPSPAALPALRQHTPAPTRDAGVCGRCVRPWPEPCAPCVPEPWPEPWPEPCAPWPEPCAAPAPAPACALGCTQPCARRVAHALFAASD